MIKAYAGDQIPVFIVCCDDDSRKDDHHLDGFCGRTEDADS
jgi:hypothetical protein